MIKHEWVFYRALNKDGNGGLLLTPPQGESVEGVREGIDYWNGRAVKEGYKAQQYLIVKHEWRRAYSVDEETLEEEFVESFERQTVVEKYPKVLKEEDHSDVVQSVLP